MRAVDLVLLGFGNVGQCVVELLEKNDGYRRDGVWVRLHAAFDRGGGISTVGRSFDELIRAKRRGKSVTAVPNGERVDVAQAFESAGNPILVDSSITDADTGEPGLAPARHALGNGISTVFASKGPLVAAFGTLAQLAAKSGARIGVSAAVGIPLPSLEVGVLGLRGSGVRRVRGVFNDTTNQILRDLEGGLTLDESIERARLEGTIEEDPRLDLDGWDAAYKLLVLARALWDSSLVLADVDTRGVGGIDRARLDEARARRKRIRLIATGESDEAEGVRLGTRPEALSADDPLYGLGPGEKGAVFETEHMGTITLRSSKGGPLATAASVMKDVLNIAAPPSPFY